MNKIPPPNFNDHTALQDLAYNDGVGSHPHLQGVVARIQQGYTQYTAARGNAFAVAPVAVTPLVKRHLKGHYKQPPKDVKYIDRMRESTEHCTCPMCGSFHCGTLDHLLPQADYPAFILFSLNLVPACKCNSKRKNTLKGANANERILHPYFDHCLGERLVRAHFEDLGPVPRVELRLLVDFNHPEYSAINFHFCTILKETAVTRHLRKCWNQLCRKPGLVVRDLKRNPPTHEALREILEEERQMLDEAHESKNNWNSIFIGGLLALPVSQWLFQRISAPGRLPNRPLI